ncbi:basic amino acid ABC transporter substrate-binding protein [Candidatus Haliotispira prima]|uniref:Basic amino acid ABC transporter substrate-binding protein n=1 Tax=Candidatus Haliotispira prima TaxID=3034016 RepID=A0ABY8MIQ3_9SPIO|nr:basic amino acid ABC transporter substrate-binding protein [Candidatus Haliotispira prima]
MMKKMLTVLAVSTVLLVLVACAKKQDGSEAEQGGGSADGPRVIRVATDATWPPMEYVNDQKEIVGFDIDVFKAAAKAAGFQIEVQNAAWDGIFAGLGNGSYEAVISSVTITEERKQAMDFSIPYINAGQVLIVRNETNDVTALSDLVGSEVGAQIGTTGALAVQGVDGVNLKTYDELGLAIADLANGKLEGVVADTPIAADFALNNAEYKDILKIVGDPFTEEYYGIAVKKDNGEVLGLINKGLESIKASGELDQLIQKWLK